MSINLKQARDFVYQNGVLWERDLFAVHFEGGSLERLHRSLRAYQNTDGGYGNAMEHDIRCPNSHPLALEFLLTVLAQNDLPPGDILDGAAAWVERNCAADGSLVNPPEVLEYPHAPWWNEGGQTMPDSIVGNLAKFGQTTADLRASTVRWVREHLTLDQIRANDWLFMAYHAYDYFMNTADVPDIEAHRAATIENIIACAAKAPEKQYYTLFRFAPTPDSPVARALAPDLLQRFVDYLTATQQDDGGWNDEHGLAQWRPYVTVTNLLALRHFGVLKG
jgi:hypothetical protein